MKYVWVLVLIFAVGCDDDTKVPLDSNKPVPTDKAFAKVKPVVERNCGDCHNDGQQKSFQSGVSMKQRGALARIQGGSMPPPPRTISEADKKLLVGYLSRL